MPKGFAAFVVLALCGMSASQSRAEELRISVDGSERTYLVERPNSSGPHPAIMMLHGAYGTSKGVAQQTELARVGPQNGFVTVFPQSQAEVWNRFPPGQEPPLARDFFRRLGRPPNDIGFLKLLVADLVRRGVADPARLYLAGTSNGGFMTLGLFCSEPRQFAAIGLIVSSMPEPLGENCHPAKALPVVIVNGTADTTVPYRGGPVAPLRNHDLHGFRVWSTDRLESFFRRLNGCEGTVQSDVSRGRGAEKIEIAHWTACAGGAVHVHRVAGATHGSVLSAMSTGQVLVNFFRSAMVGPGVRNPEVSNHIRYRRFEGNTRIDGEFRRASGSGWIETNSRGSNWTFRTVSETPSEIVLHDVGRDVYVKIEVAANKVFVRRGAAKPWAYLADIVASQK